MDATKIGDSVRLQGNWRFHGGDNPQWADPAFDDSGWRLADTEKSWDEQGMQGFRGYMWYRAKVKLPAEHGPLSLMLSDPGPSELFINGKSLGVLGRFPPDTKLIDVFPRVYTLPPVGREFSLAVRFWLPPPKIFSHVGDLASDLTIGNKDAIERRVQSIVTWRLAQDIPAFSLQVLEGAVLAGLLALFYLQRDHSEYLYLAIAILAFLLNGINDDFHSLSATPMVAQSVIGAIAGSIAPMAMIEFAFRFIREPMPRWLRFYQFSIPVIAIALIAFWAGMLSNLILNLAVSFYLIPYWFLTPGVVFWRFVRGNKEAGLLAIPLALLTLNDLLDNFGWLLYKLHLRSTTPPILKDLQVGSVPIGAEVIFNFLFLLSVGALIVYRFNRTRVQQARAHAELEAARGMQEVMVPRNIDAAGFQIETAYIPAQEVGGDFYQLFPTTDGGLLIVIGDVSGKGLKAAMLVSMIVGSLRSVVDHTCSPALILRHLNRLLIGHTDDKFATCCCALMYPDGRVIAANAGHLSPYAAGAEIELPPGIPLGISLDAEYDETQFQLPPGARLLLISDGVVEARNKSGELYGFERTQTLSVLAVNQIAEKVQEFGQDDDITILGIEPQVAVFA
jgi:hypothetical protein